MPQRNLQRVESLSEHTFPVLPEGAPSPPTAAPINWRRFWVFWGVFLLCCVISLTYTYMRPAIYESTAILQIFPRDSGTGEGPNNAKDANDATIQRHIASHASVTSRALERVGISRTTNNENSNNENSNNENSNNENSNNENSDSKNSDSKNSGDENSDEQASGDEDSGEQPSGDEDSDQTGPQLIATVIPETDVLELRAEGPDPDQLQELVNAWIEIYLESHQVAEKAATPTANAALRKQLDELESRVTKERSVLADFRGKHNIESMQRDENHVLRQMKGLSEALNKAQEEERAAAARLKALQNTLAKGQFVGEQEDKEMLAQLQRHANQLQELIEERQRILNPSRFASDEKVQKAREQLKLLAQVINRRRAMAIQRVFDEAEMEKRTAQEMTESTKAQLGDYRKQASEFTTRFAEHEVLVADLTQIEHLFRNLQKRLVQTEVIRDVLPPEVSVLQYAHTPQAPIRPHYRRDAAISVAGSLLLGLIAVLIDLLLTQPAAVATDASAERHTVIYREMETPGLPQAMPAEFVQQGPINALPHAPVRELVRELTPAEVRAMLDVSHDAERALIGGLLSGLQVRELQNLRWAEVDLEGGLVRIVGDNQRIVALCDEVRELLKHHAWQRSETSTLVWADNDQQPLSASAIDALVSSAAHVAGVPAAQDINAETVRSTYVAFLARQGVRLDLLEQTVGRLSRQMRDNFQILSPPGASEDLQEIERVYPALQATRHEAAGS